MLKAQVSKSEFKSRALELFRQVETSKQTLVVTDHGKPTIEVRPYQTRGADNAAERDPLDILRNSVLRYDDPTAPIAVDEWDALL